MTVYVREAHPGERIAQPAQFHDKLANARAYRARDRIPWTVAVDDLDGRAHHLLGRLPDLAVVSDLDGSVAFRSVWANDERSLRRALRAVAAGARAPIGERRALLTPLVRALGVTHEVLASAGHAAVRDFRRTLPPVWALGWLARAFRPLPPTARGVAALATTAAAIAVGVALVRRARP